MFGLGRWYKLAEVQPHGGGDMIAQHAAEGGVLGKVGKRFESPGDDRGSHTGSEVEASVSGLKIMPRLVLPSITTDTGSSKCSKCTHPLASIPDCAFNQSQST